MKFLFLFGCLAASGALAGPMLAAEGQKCTAAIETYTFDSSAQNASKLLFENFSIEPPSAGGPFPVIPLTPPNVAFSSLQTSPDPGRFSLPNSTTTAGITKDTFSLKSFGIYSGRSKSDSVQVFVLGYRPDSEVAVEEGPRTLQPMPNGNMAVLEFDEKFSGLRQVVVRAEESGKRVAYALDDVVVQWSC